MAARRRALRGERSTVSRSVGRSTALLRRAETAERRVRHVHALVRARKADNGVKFGWRQHDRSEHAQLALAVVRLSKATEIGVRTFGKVIHVERALSTKSEHSCKRSNLQRNLSITPVYLVFSTALEQCAARARLCGIVHVLCAN